VPSDSVSHYYDRNTRRFLLMGSGRGSRSIHRELWGPGVGSAGEAAGSIDRMVADEIARLLPGARALILDFGCGVGGTLFHLAERFPGARLHGITVSRRQVAIAERLAGKLGYADRCSFVLGDFQTARLDVRADVIVAVESFAHSATADAFLANAAKHLREGGCLILADDFLASPKDSLDARQRLRVEEFQAGWRVPAVCTTESLVAPAAARGLTAERNVDLTSHTRPGSRVRDRLVAALSPLAARVGLAGFPFYGNMIGGHALQVGLREGFLRYQLLVLRRGA
jgi:cyclopropane fatty-acyl-phospholipid synthase-like methyltransferase